MQTAVGQGHSGAPGAGGQQGGRGDPGQRLNGAAQAVCRRQPRQQGEREEQRVEHEGGRGGDLADGDCAARDARQQRGDAQRIGRQRPGQPGKQLPQRQPDQPGQQRQPAQHHQGRLGRQRQRVGDQGRKRQPPEVIGDDRQRSDLRGQREKQVFRDRRGDAPRAVFGQAARQPAGQPLLKRISVQHQPQRGHE